MNFLILALILWIFLRIGAAFKQGIKNAFVPGNVILSYILLVAAMVLFICGCYVNSTYSKKCKAGELVEGIILSNAMTRSEWNYRYDIYIASKDIRVTAYSSKYLYKGNDVMCYISAGESQKYDAVIEGSNECRKGNRLMLLAGYALVLEMITYVGCNRLDRGV